MLLKLYLQLPQSISFTLYNKSQTILKLQQYFHIIYIFIQNIIPQIRDHKNSLEKQYLKPFPYLYFKSTNILQNSLPKYNRDILTVKSQFRQFIFFNQFLLLSSRQHQYLSYMQLQNLMAILRYNNYKTMNLVIKFRENFKIYSNKMDYEVLSMFILKQFNLNKGQFNLTYQDQEGDQIMISATTDLLMMESLFQGKKMVKLYLTQLQTKKNDDVQSKNIQKQSQKKEQIIQQKKPFWHKFIKKRNENDQVKSKSKQRSKRSRSKRQCSSSQQKVCQRQLLFKQINQFIQQKVDKRVRNLLPVIVEQVKGGNPIKLFSVQNPIQHQNTTCISCLSSPIIGILYKCLSCSNFTLCQNCQARVQHQHNLLKVKKPQKIEEKLDDELNFKKIFKRLFKRHHHHKRHDDSSSSCQKGYKKHHGQFFLKKKCFKLSKVYGGQPENYVQFVKKYPELKMRQTFIKYAEQNHIEEQTAWKKIIDFKCQKLGKMFNMNQNDLRQFIQNNKQLRPRQLKQKLVQQGQTLKQRQRGGRKCWKFLNKQKEQIIEKKQKESKEIKVDQKQKQANQQKQQVAKKQPINKNQVAQKTKKLKLMINLFGNNNVPEYLKHIQKYLNKGIEQTIELWLTK